MSEECITPMQIKYEELRVINRNIQKNMTQISMLNIELINLRESSCRVSKEIEELEAEESNVNQPK